MVFALYRHVLAHYESERRDCQRGRHPTVLDNQSIWQAKVDSIDAWESNNFNGTAMTSEIFTDGSIEHHSAEMDFPASNRKHRT